MECDCNIQTLSHVLPQTFTCMQRLVSIRTHFDDSDISCLRVAPAALLNVLVILAIARGT